jgi:hypothetical protein
MGAWGSGSFDNDDAMDWVSGLTDASSDVVREALTPIASAGDQYLQAPDCSMAVAAAEAVAAARGHPNAALPEEVAAWVAMEPAVARDLVALATAAVDRILTNSELKELWDESGTPDEWRTAMSDLRERLVRAMGA